MLKQETIQVDSSPLILTPLVKEKKESRQTKYRYQNIKYFKGLNALRFFAAYFVVFYHAEQVRLKHGLYNFKEYSIANNGDIAVSFFFVLSGFLITYLLLKEQKQKRTIAIKNFYVRRILRIWPLYFLLVLIGTIIIPLVLSFINYNYQVPYQFNDVILYYVFFAPFMVNIFYGSHLLEPLWSIGVEELFYIMWAPLFKFLKNHVLKIILAVITFKILLLSFIYHFNVDQRIREIIEILKFEAMAIGGLGAYIIYYKKNKLTTSLLFSKITQVFLFTFIFLRIFAFKVLKESHIVFEYLYSTFIISDFFMLALFAWLIINVAVNPKSILKLDYRILNFLGEISYGIYMYHLIVIFTIILFLKESLKTFDKLSSTVIFYLILTVGTVFISYLSKRFFENQFLKLKSRFK